MADIFWGVSDALDLYSEYLNVQKPKNINKEHKEQNLEKPTDCADVEDIKSNVEEGVEVGLEEYEKHKDESKAVKQENLVEKALDCDPATNKEDENEIVESEKTDNKDESIKTQGTKDKSNFDHENKKIDLEQQLKQSTITNQHENDFVDTKNNRNSLEIGAGDAHNHINIGTERLTGGANFVSSSLINLEMNFNPSMKPSDCGEPITEAETEASSAEEKRQPTLNILIYGGGDPRHVIKTMAKRYSHYKNEHNACDAPILKFYLVDGCVEIMARNIVLLGIALERPELISLRNKVHLFMDVYGNSLLRPICHQYLVSKSAILLKMVSDKTVLENLAPFIKLENLKYREKDGLQDAFEFWSPKPGYDFNIKDYWTARLRRLLAVRYDCREGVFDWDLNMSLKSRGAQQICSQEYRYWRETGIAFTFPEYEQSKPNKTLAAGLVRNGSRYVHRGYIGDIQTGPFCTFGLRSMEERLHRSAHGENDYRATEVTERNLLEYFYELQNGRPYEHNNDISAKYGGVRFQMGERLIYDEHDVKGLCNYDQPWISVEGIELHFLSMTEAKPLAKAVEKWENFFDVVFVGYKYFDLLEDTFPRVLRENGLLILETKLRSVEIKNRITEFESDLMNFARDAKLEPAINYGALNTQNSILKFIKN